MTWQFEQIGTWLSSDDLFKRVEIGLVLSSFMSMATFALCLRHKLMTGAVPDDGSVLEAITDLPLES